MDLEAIESVLLQKECEMQHEMNMLFVILHVRVNICCANHRLKSNLSHRGWVYQKYVIT